MLILFINEITLRHIIVKSGLIEELSSFDAFLIATGDANSDSYDLWKQLRRCLPNKRRLMKGQKKEICTYYLATPSGGHKINFQKVQIVLTQCCSSWIY